MSNRATDPIGVILGEAVSGTTQERFQDMVAIASVIANRSAQLGTTPQNVISVQSEFNAYNKALPPGASKYRNLAEQAWSYVQKNGPIHNGTFYATPTAAKNLPGNLQELGNTKGHVYFSDPLGRSIKTAQGFATPAIGPKAEQQFASTPNVGPSPASRPNYTPFNNLDSVNRVGGLRTAWGKQPSIKGVTVHHTGGHLNPKGTVGVLNSRGLGAHFVVDRQGVPHMIAEPGTKVGHMRNSPMGFSNANTVGIEVDAKDDRDVTPAQTRGTLALIDKLTAEHPTIGRNVFGHGFLNAHKQATEGKTITDAYQNDISRLNSEAFQFGLDKNAGPATAIAGASPATNPAMGSGDNLTPSSEWGGMGGVGRAPIGPVSRAAPAMPASMELSPNKPTTGLKPSAESFAPPSTADLAAAYGQMGSTMQQAGVNRLGTMPAPNSPVASPYGLQPLGSAETFTQPGVTYDETGMRTAPVQAARSTRWAATTPKLSSLPPSLQPRAIPQNGFPSRPTAPPTQQSDFMGNIKGADQFGTTTVTNRFGVTTGMTPHGKQTAYGKGVPSPVGRTSLFGGAQLPGSIGKALPGILGGLAGTAVLGPVGGIIGGLIGQQLGKGLARNSFPSAPSPLGDSWRGPDTKGKALSKSERSSISPAASRSMSKNGGKTTGLW